MQIRVLAEFEFSGLGLLATIRQRLLEQAVCSSACSHHEPLHALTVMMVR
jgi:hypothetical protein